MNPESQNPGLIIGIVTVSDRASSGVYSPIGSDAIEQYMREKIVSPWRPEHRLTPDGTENVRNVLIELTDSAGCALILTTGGTGPAGRDCTPEATEAACTRMMPGFGELMRRESLKQVPTAILSRQCAGVRGRTLIVNLPGRPGSIRTCLDAVFPAIPYCLELIGSPGMETEPKAFRPPG